MKGFSVFGALFLVFAVWVVLAADNGARIERTCRPVLWLGNVSVSLSSLISSGQDQSVQNAFNRMNYGCRYTVWRLFFEKDYLQAVKDGRVNPQRGDKQ